MVIKQEVVDLTYASSSDEEEVKDSRRIEYDKKKRSPVVRVKDTRRIQHTKVTSRGMMCAYNVQGTMIPQLN